MLTCLSYEFKEKIGNGSFGEVWLVKNKKSGKKCVLKKLVLTGCSQVEKQRAVLESQLLATLQHSNIVTYYDSYFESKGKCPDQDRDVLNIVMCFCEGGDMYEHLQKRKGKPVEEHQIVEWLIQLCMALKYLNDRHILHRDLKTRNIFLTRKGLVKIGDFGIARVLDGTSDMAATLIGTPYYMSPEILTGKPYNHKSDIWSLGCCIYEMASLKHAFRARNFNSLLYKVLHCKSPEISSTYSQELSSLTGSMLNSDPERRPSAQCILVDPFIRKHMLRFLEMTKRRSSVVKDQLDNDFQQVSDTTGTMKAADELHATNLNYKDDSRKPESPKQETNTAKQEAPEDHKISRNKFEVCIRQQDIIDKPTACVQTEITLKEFSSKSKDISTHHEETSANCPEIQNTRSEEVRNTEGGGNLNRENVATGCTGDNAKAVSARYSPTEARLRRRKQNLQKCSFSEASLDDCSATSQKNTASFQCQKPNTSARQRRRERLKQATCDVQEGPGKSRPKSAPSRLTKKT